MSVTVRSSADYNYARNMRWNQLPSYFHDTRDLVTEAKIIIRETRAK